MIENYVFFFFILLAFYPIKVAVESASPNIYAVLLEVNNRYEEIQSFCYFILL